MQPQPKVVDQELAQMVAAPQQQSLPEDSGIGQLPAQNMQGMAAGGIVAFDDGGSVPGYADGVFVGQGFNQNQLVPPPTQNRNALIASRSAEIATQATQDELKRIETQLQSMPPSPQRDFLENRKRVLLSNASATVAAPAASAPPTAPALPPSATQVMSGLPATKVPPNTGTPPPPPGTGAPVAAKPAAPAAPVDPMAGIKALNTNAKTAAEAKTEAAALGDDTEIRKKLEEYVTGQKKAGEESVSAFEKGIATLPKSYEKYEARLQKEETEAATDKDKAVGMSIFKAGLAMMSGTSQNAFENIGKGAMVGLEDQQAALKDFKKAQRERDKSFADIEASRLADQRGDLKTKLELQNRASERNAAAEGKMIDGIAKLFDTNTTNARGIYTTGLDIANKNQSTMYTTQADFAKQSMADKAALQRTNIQANAPTGIERILSNPKMLAAYKDYASAGTESKGINAFALEAIKDPSLLPRLEAGSAQDRQLAASIKQHMQGMMVSPVNLPGGAANVRP
jgi:hypothetical protein